jgi:hypothetical protein
MSSRRFSSNKKIAVGTGCKHCQNMGENTQVWTSHNTLDRSGRVCCPKILANVCVKCNVRGHLPSRCPGKKPMADTVRLPAFVFREVNRVFCDVVECPRTPVKTRICVEAPGAPVKSMTGPKSLTKPIVLASQMDWSIESDDEDW